MFDHSMAINSNDPLLPELQTRYPDGIVVYEDLDPTTEVIAKDIFDFIAELFEKGWSNDKYKIPAGKITLERVRVWETPQSWAEYGF
jgi:6-pyruvoyltetrahydropterin/6-carboxytetrahydropterin synthase